MSRAPWRDPEDLEDDDPPDIDRVPEIRPDLGVGEQIRAVEEVLFRATTQYQRRDRSWLTPLPP